MCVCVVGLSSLFAVLSIPAPAWCLLYWDVVKICLQSLSIAARIHGVGLIRKEPGIGITTIAAIRTPVAHIDSPLAG